MLTLTFLFHSCVALYSYNARLALTHRVVRFYVMLNEPRQVFDARSRHQLAFLPPSRATCEMVGRACTSLACNFTHDTQYINVQVPHTRSYDIARYADRKRERLNSSLKIFLNLENVEIFYHLWQMCVNLRTSSFGGHSDINTFFNIQTKDKFVSQYITRIFSNTSNPDTSARLPVKNELKNKLT